jgi:hypothetical protein
MRAMKIMYISVVSASVAVLILVYSGAFEIAIKQMSGIQYVLTFLCPYVVGNIIGFHCGSLPKNKP